MMSKFGDNMSYARTLLILERLLASSEFLFCYRLHSVHAASWDLGLLTHAESEVSGT